MTIWLTLLTVFEINLVPLLVPNRGLLDAGWQGSVPSGGNHASQRKFGQGGLGALLTSHSVGEHHRNFSGGQGFL